MRRLLLPVLLIMIFLSGCQGETVQTPQGISMSDISSITIKAPPKVKKIDEKEDIEKIINHINSIKMEKTEQEDINGCEFWIQTKGKIEHSITLVGNLIKIDGVWYRINSDEVKKFRELYNSLNYKEEPV